MGQDTALGGGETAQQLRAVTALPEPELILAPNTAASKCL